MQLWPRVEQLVSDALAYDDGLTSLEDVKQSLASGSLELWLIFSDDNLCAATVVTTQAKPAGRVLSVVILSGNSMVSWLDEWVSFVKEYCRAHNCVAIQAHGRRGWVKVLEKFGWKEQFTTISLKV